MAEKRVEKRVKRVKRRKTRRADPATGFFSLR
jgi:hypothetical protein